MISYFPKNFKVIHSQLTELLAYQLGKNTNNIAINADFSIRKALKINIVVYLEINEYFTIFSGFFRNFLPTLPYLFIDLTGYFAFFSMRKKATDIILADLESPARGLHFWFFLFLDYFLLWKHRNVVLSKRNH